MEGKAIYNGLSCSYNYISVCEGVHFRNLSFGLLLCRGCSKFDAGLRIFVKDVWIKKYLCFPLPLGFMASACS